MIFGGIDILPGSCAVILTLAIICYWFSKYNTAITSNQQAKQLIEHLAEGVYRSTLDGKQLSANKALVELNGFETEDELLESVQNIATEWYVDPNRRAEFSKELEKNGQVTDFVSEIYRFNTRERIWISENARLVHHPITGRALYYEGTVRDITATVKHAEHDKLIKNLTDKLPHGLFQLVRWEDKSYTCPYVSKRFREMIDLADDAEFDGIVFASYVHKDDQEIYGQTLRDSERELTDWYCQFRFIRPSGGMDWCKIVATPERGKNGETIWHGYLSNITQRVKAEEEVYKLAYFDPLTGLSNRTHFIDNVTTALSQAQSDGTYCALGFIDLDNFKLLNDTHGHGFGDLLLQAVANRLEDNLPKGSKLSRFGGDEFVFLFSDLGDTLETAEQKTDSIAAQILKDIGQGFTIEDIFCPMTMSLGISMSDPTQALSVTDLLKSADVAMYEAKKSGRNNYVIYDTAMLQQIAQKYGLQRDLQNAIRNNQLEIELQPQLTTTGKIVCAETLVRWNHPERGRIMPGEFIDLAEQVGQIGPLNDWVLNESIKVLSSWQQDPSLRDISMSVNISPRQMLDHRFAERVKHLMREAKIPPKALILEVTEHVMASKPEMVERHMRTLKEAGIQFSLDDFGTGYSSISQLRQFPFDELKIDGSFVSEITSVAETQHLVKAIIDMAEALGLNTVAEHVTTLEQFEMLSSMGCSLYQGYLFSRALAVKDFELLARLSNPCDQVELSQTA